MHSGSKINKGHALHSLIKGIKCLSLICFALCCNTPAVLAANIEAVLDSNNGSSAFVVEDSGAITMASIDSDGKAWFSNVGIGTTVPRALLDVNGIATINQLGIGTTTATSLLNFPAGTTVASGILFGSDVNLYRSQANRLRTDDALDADGGIYSTAGTFTGTVTATSFVGNGANLTNISTTAVNPAGNNNDVQYKNAAGALAGSDAFVFNGTNVGIGTLGPRTMLEVDGTVYATNIGIGSTSPAAALDIPAGTLRLNGMSMSSDSGNLKFDNWNSIWVADVRGTNYDLAKVDSTSVLRVDTTNSRIGIGTTAPAARVDIGGGTATYIDGVDDLLVKGDIEADGNVYGVSGTFTGTLTANAFSGDGSGLTGVASAGGWTDGTNVVYTTTGADNVGIGTTTPAKRLDIVVSSNTDGLRISGGGIANIGLTMKNTGTGGRPFSFSSTGSGHALGDGKLVLFPNELFNGTPIITFDGNNGNVGVGTTAPGAKLEVLGSGATSATTAFAVRDSASAAKFMVLDDGSVGIGTAPTSFFTVYHPTDPRIEIRSDAGYMYISKFSGPWSGTTNPFIFQANGGDLVYTTALNDPTKGFVVKDGGNVGFGYANPGTAKVAVNGNLGIGTTAPAARVDVGGGTRTYIDGVDDLLVKGDIEADGDIYGAAGNFTGTVTANAFVGNGSGLTGVAAAGGWTDGGSNVYTTTATDNVGVGTASPSELLDVAGKIALSGKFKLSYGTVAGASPATGLTIESAVSDGKMMIGDAGEVTFFGNQTFFGYADRADSSNAAKTGGFYKVNGVQNIWSNLASKNMLSIADNGDIAVDTNSYGTYSSDGATSNIPARFYVNGTTAINGNVGIGTTAPGSGLHLYRDIDDASSAEIRVENANSGTLVQSRQRFLTNDSTAALVLTNKSTAHFAGVQGFWVSTEAQGGGYVPALGFAQTSNVRLYIPDSDNANYGDIQLGGAAAATSPMMVIKNSGNVGIGAANPLGKLSIAGKIVLDDTRASDGGLFFDTNSSFSSGLVTEVAGEVLSYGINVPQVGTRDAMKAGGIFRLDARDTEQKFIIYAYPAGDNNFYDRFSVSLQDGTVSMATTGGNVGIGSSVPQEKLEVVGTVKATAFSGDGSGLTGVASAGGWTDGTNVVYTTVGTDNVGIGTTNPTGLLDVGGWPGKPALISAFSNINGDLFVGNTGANVGRFRQSSNANQGFIGWNTYYNNTNSVAMDTAKPGFLISMSGGGGEDAVQFLRAPATAGPQAFTALMHLDGATGNIGIATTLPVARLDLVGTGTTSATSALIIRNSDKTARVAILDNGNVGIGTATPGSALAVIGGASFSSGVSIGGVGNSAGLTIGENGNIHPANGNITLDSWGGGYGVYLKGGTGVFVQSPSGTERMRVDNAGNVGIGSAAPTQRVDIKGGDMTLGAASTANGSASEDLFVKGNISADGIIYGNGAGITGIAAAGGWTDGANVVYTTVGTDNVGIGTATPSSLLHLRKDQGAYTELRVHNSNSTSAASAGLSLYGGQDVPTANFISYSTNAAAPDTNRAVLNATSNIIGLNIKAESTSGTINFYTGGATNERMRLDKNGNVGIGTSAPTALVTVIGANKLPASPGIVGVFSNDSMGTDIGGQITMGGRYSTSDTTMANYGTIAGRKENAADNDASGYLAFGTSISAGGTNTEKMRITSTGNMGIGTTVPVARMDLVGTGTTLATSNLILRNAVKTALVTVLDNGNMGIGATPSHVFDVVDNSNTSSVNIAEFRNAYNGGEGETTILLTNSAASGTTSAAITATRTNSPVWAAESLSFKTYNGSALRTTMKLNYTGNVGIGTTVPAAQLDIGGGTATNIDGTDDLLVKGDIEADGNIYGTAGTFSGTLTANAFSGNGSGLTGIAAAGGWTDGTNVVYTTVGTDNVGIGSTAPVGLLDVSGGPVNLRNLANNAVAPTLNISNQSGDASGMGVRLGFFNRVNNGNFLGAITTLMNGSTAASNTDMQFFTGGDTATVKMTIKGSGNVGIGSVTPGASLELVGTGTTSATSALVIRDSVQAAKVTVLDNGNVGIGTTGPLTLVHVNEGRLRMTSASGSASTKYGEAYFDGTNFVLSQANSSGNSGVQITTGDGSAIWRSSMYGGAAYNGWQLDPGSKDLAINSTKGILLSSYGAVGNNLSLAANGNVGIGSAVPQAKLEVDGTIYVRGGVANSQVNMYNGTVNGYVGIDPSTNNMDIATYTNHPVRIETNNAVRVTVDGTGNVGIGSAAPQQALDVVGTVKATAFSGNGSGLSNVAGTVSGLTAGKVPYAQNGNTLIDSSIYTNGTNIGIGTTVPTARLDVISDNSTVTAFHATATAAVGGAIPFMMSADSSSTGPLIARIGHNANSANFSINSWLDIESDMNNGFMVLDGGDGATGLEILPNGANLLVGSTSDNSLAKLQVTGNAMVSDRLIVGAAPASTPDISIYRTDRVGDAVYFAVENGDNTNGASNGRFDVRVGGADGGDPYVNLDISNVGGWSMGIDNSDNDTFKIDRGAPPSPGVDTKLAIQTNGNIGIGIATPGSLLHVSKGSSGATVDVNAQFAVENAGHAFIDILSDANSYAGFYFGNPADAHAGELSFDAAANQMFFKVHGGDASVTIDGATKFVGIGPVTPGAAFDVYNKATINASGHASFAGGTSTINADQGASYKLLASGGTVSSRLTNRADSGGITEITHNISATDDSTLEDGGQAGYKFTMALGSYGVQLFNPAWSGGWSWIQQFGSDGSFSLGNDGVAHNGTGGGIITYTAGGNVAVTTSLDVNGRTNFVDNVGIGTTVPAARLDIGGGTRTYIDGVNDLLVKGDVEADGNVYGTAGTFTGTVTANVFSGSGAGLTNLPGAVLGLTPGYLPHAQTADTLVDSVIYSDGTNVGIGSTVPQARLQIASGQAYTANAEIARFSYDTTNNRYVRIKQTGTSSILESVSSSLTVGTGGADTLSLQTQGTTKITILSGGSVGIGTIVPNSKLQVAGSFAVDRTSTAVNASSAAETIIGVTNTGSARTITLSDTDKVAGRIVIVKDESGGAATNNITVQAQTGTIDGAASVVITANYGVVRVYSDGSNWFTF